MNVHNVEWTLRNAGNPWRSDVEWIGRYCVSAMRNPYSDPLRVGKLLPDGRMAWLEFPPDPQVHPSSVGIRFLSGVVLLDNTGECDVALDGS